MHISSKPSDNFARKKLIFIQNHYLAHQTSRTVTGDTEDSQTQTRYGRWRCSQHLAVDLSAGGALLQRDGIPRLGLGRHTPLLFPRQQHSPLFLCRKWQYSPLFLFRSRQHPPLFLVRDIPPSPPLFFGGLQQCRLVFDGITCSVDGCHKSHTSQRQIVNGRGGTGQRNAA